jgi:hypothetical protein
MTGEPKNWSEHERESDEYEPRSVAMSAAFFGLMSASSNLRT